MESTKFVGLDVHKEAVSIAVMNSGGKLIMESIIETKAITILQFIQGLRGDLYVTFEEGTWAAWLYDLLKPHVTKVVVCNPRKSALLLEGSGSDTPQHARAFHPALEGAHRSRSWLWTVAGRSIVCCSREINASEERTSRSEKQVRIKSRRTLD